MTELSFTRYLAAKKTVDDRALNAHVWGTLAASLPAGPLRVLEVGAGIGTMAERTAERGLLADARYTLVDEQSDNLAAARERLRAMPGPVKLEFHAADLFEFIAAHADRQWDLLIAHAVLDLLDVPRALPRLLAAVRPGGLVYFSLNFDGLTIFEPAIDPEFDRLIERLYHRTMDERITRGAASGDSRIGRRLIGHLRRAGVDVLAAGASDWVVLARDGRYPDDEAYFLRFIIHTVHGALRGHPELDPARFDAWAAERGAQIERGELIYIAHQMDVLGRLPGA